MNKLKKLSVALCLCVCMVIGAVFVGCDNPEQTQEIENLQTQIEQLQTDITNLNNQLEELQTENSQLKEVTAVDVLKELKAAATAMPDNSNALFEHNTNGVYVYLDFSLLRECENMNIEYFVNNLGLTKSNTVYSIIGATSTEAEISDLAFLNDGNNYAVVLQRMGYHYICKVELNENGTLKSVSCTQILTGADSFSDGKYNYCSYYNAKIEFNNEQSGSNAVNQTYGATFTIDYYSYYIDSQTNKVDLDNEDNSFVKLQGECNYFVTYGQLIGIIENAEIYNDALVDNNELDSSMINEYLYTDTVTETALAVSDLQDLIDSQEEMVDLSVYEVVEINTATGE